MRRGILLFLLISGCGPTGRTGANGEGICHPPACAIEGSTTYAAELSPNMNAGAFGNDEAVALAQEWSTVEIDPNSGTFSLRLISPVVLSGRVTVDGVPIQAVVIASRSSRIPGRPDVIYEANTDPETGQYRLFVTPTQGTEQYAFRAVASTLSEVPPRRFEFAVQGDRQLDIELDSTRKAVEIRGAVRTPLQRGIPGMAVEVVDPSGVLLSTLGTTDQAGQYSVLVDHTVDLSSSTKPALVIAVPGVNSPAGTPSLTTAITTTARVPGGAALVIDLPVPALPVPIHVAYRVSGVSPSGAETPIVAAHCQFRTDVSDRMSTVSAIYQIDVVSEAEGTAQVDLLPGVDENRVYDVRIFPPPDSEFETSLLSSSIGSAGGYAAPFVLPLKPQISGRVVDSSWRPVADVKVESVFTMGELTPLVGLFSAPSTNSAAKSDRDGRFAIRVDRATYDLSLLPPSATHLPRRWFSGHNIASDTELGDLQLVGGIAVRAQVLGPTGLPTQGASVRLYALPPANSPCTGEGLGCQALLQAEGTSDERGEIALLLPKSTL
jgi:hypothetical protein